MPDALARVLIVDDEPLARERLRTLLADDSRVEIVAERRDGPGAVEAIRELSPDLVFLDVQMPGCDGFEVVERIGAERMPLVIFVTAFDEYAIRAFDVYALDYLLKPFDRARFDQALVRALDRLAESYGGPGTRTGNRVGPPHAASLADQLRELLAEVRGAAASPALGDRLLIKSRGRIRIVDPGEIEWIQAAGNYVRLHLGKESHLMRETMTAMAERLPDGEFVRVSRSAIVRVDRIGELRLRSHGEYTVVLRDGTSVKASRTYADGLTELLEG